MGEQNCFPIFRMPPISEEKLCVALQSLLEQDQLVLLIQMAEKWTIKRELPSKAALLEAKAFFRLCVLEQAWRCLSKVENSPEKLELTLDIYLSRGWVTKARKVLIKLQHEYPNHPKIEAFHNRISHGVKLPKNYEQILKRGTPSQVLALAERFFCLGKTVLAQKIVQKVLQVEPRNQMARRLLWAQRGDFASSLTFLQLWSQINVPLKEVEPETTVANVTQTADGFQNSSLGAPLMFFGQENAIDPDELTAEITREFVFAEVHQEPTQNFDSFQEEQVTQAIDYMLSDSRAETEIWGHPDKTPPQKMPQDNEVIVFTEHEPQTSEIGIPPQFNDKSVKVIVRNPSPNSTEAPQLIEPDGYTDEKQKEARRLPILLTIVLVFLLLIAGAFWGIKKIATDNLERDMQAPIFSADQRELQQYILQLKAQEDTSLISVEARSLVILFSEYLFWRDFKREAGVLARLKKEIEQEEEAALPWLFHSTRALLAIEAEDFDRAKEEMRDVEESNLIVEWVNIEIAHALGEKWRWKEEYRFSPRLETLAIIDGLKEPNFASNHGWVLVASLRDALGEMDAAQTGVVIEKLQEKEATLGARYGANFLLLRSLLHEEPDSPKARLLRYQAYQKADYDPDIQFWYGYDLFLAGKLKQATRIFGECYQHRIACSSGYIFLLVEREQMDTAKAVVKSLNDAHPMKELLMQYVKQRNGEDVTASRLSDFWSVNAPSLDSAGLFWMKLQEQKDIWAVNQRTDSIWFWSYRAQIAMDARNYQIAFRAASKAVTLSKEYTKMYRILAMSGERLRKVRNEDQFWELYLAQQPQGFGLDLANNRRSN